MLRPEPLTPDHFDACISLLKVYPFKPYAHYARRVGEKALEQLFLSQVEANLGRKAHSALWIPGPDGAQGLAIWARLDWDSQQLGVGAGRLDYLIASGDYEEQYATKEALLAAVLQACGQQGIQHLSARVHASDLSTIHLLERHGFITVDGILTFSFDLSPQRREDTRKEIEDPSCPGAFVVPEKDFEIRLSRPEDIEQIKAIARSSYVYDRFHSDPRIPKAVADELHAVWLENSCRGKAADAVVVAAEKGRILGFVTCKIDRQTTRYLGLTIGTIVLVATAADARGRGVARATTYGALDWFRDQGVDIVEVGTQLRNIPASRLYEACGFRLVASSLSLRKWIDHA
ncbi:MAG TPA: GNAT family N-acetyltransferase [Anaerolineae bacterium]|nr:GNAT family N-acetyltransferase [Anaerolineae bacterium]